MNIFRRILKPAKTSPTEQQTSTHMVHPDPIANQLDVGRLHAAISASIQGDNRDLYTIYRDLISSDSHLQGELSKRKLAVLGDEFNIVADNPDDTAPADLLNAAVANCKNWTNGLAHLMDSVLYPVAVAEKVFAKSKTPGLRYELAKIVPVDHHLIEFVNGVPHLRELDPAGFPTGALIEIDPARYIVHQGHLLSTPHQFGGPFRALIFWCLFTAMDRDWWIRFLERFGSPFLVGKYDQNDDASRRILERAFRASARIFGLVVSRDTEVEIQQASASASGDAYEKFFSIAQREKSKFILGQTASTEGTPGKLGNDQLQSDVREDLRRFDAATLSETLRNQAFQQLMEINGISGDTPNPIWGAADADSAEINGQLIQSLSMAGITVTDEGLEILSRRVGFPLQRSALPATPSPFSADSLPDAIGGQRSTLQAIRGASADYAQALRLLHADAAKVIQEADSPDAAIAALSAQFDMPSDRATELLARVLGAATANGILSA
jgi:phage gp29-like protein